MGISNQRRMQSQSEKPKRTLIPNGNYIQLEYVYAFPFENYNTNDNIIVKSNKKFN